MGYNLTIGEREPDTEGVGYDSAAVVAMPEAPADGVPTDHTNQRWPSYSGWSDFCEHADLTDVMYAGAKWNGEQLAPLMPEHPAAAEITQAHFDCIWERLSRVKRLNPDDLARVEWLVFRMRWALENCEHPTFSNH